MNFCSAVEPAVQDALDWIEVKLDFKDVRVEDYGDIEGAVRRLLSLDGPALLVAKVYA